MHSLFIHLRFIFIKRLCYFVKRFYYQFFRTTARWRIWHLVSYHKLQYETTTKTRSWSPLQLKWISTKWLSGTGFRVLGVTRVCRYLVLMLWGGGGSRGGSSPPKLVMYWIMPALGGDVERERLLERDLVTLRIRSAIGASFDAA